MSWEQTRYKTFVRTWGLGLQEKIILKRILSNPMVERSLNGLLSTLE
jgi:hypothetical protein